MRSCCVFGSAESTWIELGCLLRQSPIIPCNHNSSNRITISFVEPHPPLRRYHPGGMYMRLLLLLLLLHRQICWEVGIVHPLPLPFEHQLPLRIQRQMQHGMHLAKVVLQHLPSRLILGISNNHNSNSNNRPSKRTLDKCLHRCIPCHSSHLGRVRCRCKARCKHLRRRRRPMVINLTRYTRPPSRRILLSKCRRRRVSIRTFLNRRRPPGRRTVLNLWPTFLSRNR